MASGHDIPEGSTRVRASGIASAFDCMYRWEGEQLIGLRKPGSPRSLLGNAVHHGTAVFDTAVMQGNPLSVGDAAEAVVKVLKDEKKETDWTGSDLRPREVEKIALNLYTRYCLEWSPRFEYAAVELSIPPMTLDCNGTLITLTGSLDRTRVYRLPTAVPDATPLLRVGDLKTGARIISQGKVAGGKHRPQVGVYELLTEATLDQPVDTTSEILGLSTSGKGEIAMGEVTGSRQLLLGTDEWPGLLDLFADNLKAGRFPPNPSSVLCSNRYCSRWTTCPYHD